ncbi:MAG: menaquinone biosynthesis protein [Candidatus Rokubacteria bacterium]|nr:menaquinone biosynthesis protein [Candidatus Rokubacteria bacterium]
MPRVGRIPYLNCEPFFSYLQGFDLIPLTPRALGQAVAAGSLDAGPLSLVDLLSLQGALTPLPFGIATVGAARSVLLFSDRPLPELGGAVIGVTDETSTSIQLLRILLELKYRAIPQAWIGPEEPCDALLLIGDRAIRALKSGPPFPHATDLGREWVQWTGLPCVFARWGVRASVPEAEQLALSRALDTALDRGLADLPGIASRRRDTGFTEAEVIAYLGGFVYRLGAEEEKAIAEFTRLREFLEKRPC